MAKIRCPKCGRILGDTRKSIDCNLNCRGCKQVVQVKLVMASTTDYFKHKEKQNG